MVLGEIYNAKYMYFKKGKKKKRTKMDLSVVFNLARTLRFTIRQCVHLIVTKGIHIFPLFYVSPLGVWM